jgi:hypothetical protein
MTRTEPLTACAGGMALFRSVYPPETWGQNPWCWVYEFEMVEGWRGKGVEG